MPILGIVASGITSSTIITGSYESIQTVTLAPGNTSSSISFTSIPATFKHLQIRGVSKTNRGYSGNIIDGLLLSYNSAAATKYHMMQNYSGSASANSTEPPYIAQDGSGGAIIATQTMSMQIIDILDYTSSNNKTTRTAFGMNGNTVGGFVGLDSALHAVNTAITSITLTPYVGAAFVQYTSFALYGIKG